VADGPEPVELPADLGYAEALAELEQILAELDQDEVDVDRLATTLRRATALIDHCRGRIADARVEVERVAADLTPPPGPAAERGDGG
jgi:exodeoxyribonuclease VII small subunit